MSAELMSMTLNAAKYSQENKLVGYSIKSIVIENKLSRFYFEFWVLNVKTEIIFDSDIDYDEFYNLCKDATIKGFEKKLKEDG